jgi:hypothetical protein
MTFSLFTILLLASSVAAGILLLVRRMTAAGAISECDPEWAANFSIASYRPMLRLLSEEDYKFFAAQRGITSQAVRRFRQERRRVFRSYLRNLVKDFHRLHLAARMTLIYSAVDRPELAQVLMTQRLTFALALMKVEYRLVLHTFGIGAVDVRELLGALDDMNMNVSFLAASHQPASS